MGTDHLSTVVQSRHTQNDNHMAKLTFSLATPTTRLKPFVVRYFPVVWIVAFHDSASKRTLCTHDKDTMSSSPDAKKKSESMNIRNKSKCKKNR